jgi:hypothetical protein
MANKFIVSSLAKLESVTLTIGLTLTILLAAIYLSFFSLAEETIISKSISSNYPLLVSTSAGLIGFLATALSIVIFLPNSGKVENLRDSADYKSLLGAFIITILVQIAIFVLSLFGMILTIDNIIFSFLLIWIIGLSVIWILLTVYVFYKFIQFTL